MTKSGTRTPGVDSQLFDECKGRLLLAQQRFSTGKFGEAVIFYKQALASLGAPALDPRSLNSATHGALAWWRCHAEEGLLVAQDRHAEYKRLVSRIKRERRNPEEVRTHRRKQRRNKREREQLDLVGPGLLAVMDEEPQLSSRQ